MSWETTIARRMFPKDQKFMAKRKLRLALWVVLVGVLASLLFVGILWLAEHQRQ